MENSHHLSPTLSCLPSSETAQALEHCWFMSTQRMSRKLLHSFIKEHRRSRESWPEPDRKRPPQRPCSTDPTHCAHKHPLPWIPRLHRSGTSICCHLLTPHSSRDQSFLRSFYFLVSNSVLFCFFPLSLSTFFLSSLGKVKTVQGSFAPNT